MAGNILDRLYSLDYVVGGHGKSMYAQAADEIDRLQHEIAELKMRIRNQRAEIRLLHEWRKRDADEIEQLIEDMKHNVPYNERTPRRDV